MISCKDAATLISRSLDDKLPIYRRIQIFIHLSVCDLCTLYSNQLTMIRQALLSCVKDMGDSVVGEVALSDQRREDMIKTLRESL